MPKLELPQNNFTKAIQEKVRLTRCNMWEDETGQFAKENDQEVIGSGAECIAVPGEKIGETETVVAFNYFDMNPLRMKEIFYAQRILSTLFPHNFPHFYVATGADPKDLSKLSGTIRQRIERNSSKNIPVIFPLEKVKETCRDIGLPLFISENTYNQMIGEDGGEYFIDTVDAFPPERINTVKLFSYMKENNFLDSDIATVKGCIHRLEDVYAKAIKQSEERKKLRANGNNQQEK